MVLPGRAEVNTMVDLGKLAGTEKGAVWRTRVANRDASVGNLQAVRPSSRQLSVWQWSRQ